MGGSNQRGPEARLTAFLPLDVLAELERRAVASHERKSALIAAALREYFEQHPRPEPLTAPRTQTFTA